MHINFLPQHTKIAVFLPRPTLRKIQLISGINKQWFPKEVASLFTAALRVQLKTGSVSPVANYLRSQNWEHSPGSRE